MDPSWISLIVTAFGSAMASTGFWAFISKRFDRKDNTTRLLMGLAHNQIIQTGDYYIKRGWISKEEYEDFHTYLYDPYEDFGGNGLARRIKIEVDQLPISRPKDNL